jgi:hypothetical protein
MTTTGKGTGDPPSPGGDRRVAARPYTGPDRRKVSLPPSEWNSALQEVMEHVEEARAAAPVLEPERSWRPLALVFLFLAFAGVVAWNVVQLREESSPAFPQQRVLEGMEATMLLTIMELEQIRSETGEYPASLVGTSVDRPDLSYRRTAGGFVLEGRTLLAPVVYTSGDDLTRFEESLDMVMRAAGGGE